ncbi:hypothetical protein DUNSADRAFT_17961 [Dunaliella salina]|uniref:Uncharacterized protein n=1 Tax=Dunaliella salina TaxID=3046 RepID=A0ABQ7GZL8_DUNSA|nr:hypothetical protein DUNSADRAFT_17961 [Dunaliella salina]|eukprot:KAF5840044.1 hypothetical protein DUNSADRAFT_17961 [Dunaliella salina]
MWDEQLVAMVSRQVAGGPSAYSVPQAAQLAQLLANQAFQNAKDPNIRSPWAVESAQVSAGNWFSRMFPRGGKMDDIAVAVGLVQQVL